MFANKTIVENAVNSKDHETLVAAVKAAGLVNTLSGPGPFTVFAPTDRAFEKLPAGTVESLVQPAQKATLTSVLTYHVVPGRFTAQDLMDEVKQGGGKAVLTTAQGGTLTVMRGRQGPDNHRLERRQVAGDDRQRPAVERRHPRRRFGDDALSRTHGSGARPRRKRRGFSRGRGGYSRTRRPE
jgi:hypothetical protein